MSFIALAKEVRNDYFEYHLFLLKTAAEQKMLEKGCSIIIQRGSAARDVLPSLKIEKLGFTISYKETVGYCLEAQSQEDRLFSEISDICKALCDAAAGINMES